METREDALWDWRWISFLSRVMVGLLFFMAGWYKVFTMTPVGHAERYFLGPYADSWIPLPLLWNLGVTIPFVELLAGAALIVGWRRRAAAVVLGFLLLVVTYGHALAEPLFDVTTHVLPRLALLLPALGLGVEHDPYSVDGLIRRSASGAS